MRARFRLAAAAAVIAVAAAFAGGSASAGGRENPNEYGFYSPLDAKGSAYRYHRRSWYYRQPEYYPYYGSSYWVPRADMRYRYRRQYYGPQYRHFPAWGYPLAEHNQR